MNPDRRQQILGYLYSTCIPPHSVVLPYRKKMILLKLCGYFRDEKPDGSLLTFVIEQILNSCPACYGLAFAFSILLCLHYHQQALRLALPEATIQVYQVPHNAQMAGSGSVCPPEAYCPCIPKNERDDPLHTFWFRLFSIFSLFVLTMFIDSSLVLTMPANLALHPHDACR